MRYRAEIDGLRAVAVLPVILFHAGLPVFRGGFVGVDVFFVISGFLITRIISDEIGQGTFSFLRFYERRARRILPALFIVLGYCVIAGWLILTPAEMEMFSKSAGAVALFVSNMFLMRNSGYFAVASELMPLLHTWSLAVEEQFYIVMPFIVLALPRLGMRRFVMVLAGMAVASFALSLGMLQRGMTGQAFYLMPTRAWELLAGSLAALVPGAGRKGQVAAALGLAAIAVPVFAFSRLTPTPSWPTLLPVLGTVLVLRHATRETVVGRILALPPLVWIGLLSYSAYLWHQPLFAFARILYGHVPLAGMLALSVMSLVLAWLTWRFIETPTRRGVWWPWKSQLRVLNTSGVGLLIVLVFAVTGYRTEGFAAQRVAPDRLGLLESARSSPLRDRCHAGRGPGSVARACVLGGADASWAVLGDSHGVELAYALAQGLQPMGIGLRQLTYSACGPVLSAAFPSDPCVEWHRAAVQAIAQDPQIGTVAIIYRLNLHLLGADSDAAATARTQMTWESYLEEIRLLRGAGKRVIAVLPVPELPHPVDQILFRADADAPVIGAEMAWWRQRNGFVDRRRAELSAAANVVIDPADSFCTSTACLAARDGAALYFDTNHPSVAGAGRIADMILGRLFVGAQRLSGPDVVVTGGGNL